MAIVLKVDDLREKVREKKQGNSILFMVDGSGSIGAQKRMVAVKGAILSMLKDAYQKRDEIGMAVFRIDKAKELLPLTKSILKAYNVLAEIPTGGRTPLIHGLLKGHEILKDRVTKNASPVMVILSDGRCNVSFTPGMRSIEEMLMTARSLSESKIRFIVIDTEVGTLRFGLALELCRALNGTYLCLEDLNAEYIESSVRMVMREV
jgi:magnesium chelatase subunit D